MPMVPYQKTEFDAWRQLIYDENDTVLESQWYVDRGSPNPLGAEPSDAEQRAAWLAAKHAGTPSQQHFDSLGRTVYAIADNGVAGKYSTRSVLDIENNFTPTYEVQPDKERVIAELKKLTKSADMIWLASDEDREGEAISWHLYETLGLTPKNTKRIVFHEITKPAILKAIENPRDN